MSKRYEIKFYVGTEENKHNRLISRDRREEYLAAARKHLALTWGAFTEYQHFGAWLAPGGASVAETGVTFVVIGELENGPDVKESAATLRDIFVQSAVLVTRSVIEAEFI